MREDPRSRKLCKERVDEEGEKGRNCQKCGLIWPLILKSSSSNLRCKFYYSSGVRSQDLSSGFNIQEVVR